MTSPAIPTSPTLDGVDLVGADASEWRIRTRQIKSVVQLATGGRREFLAYAGPGKPYLVKKHEITLTYASLGELAPTVEELMESPGPHQLILWRANFVAFACDGARDEFEMPWQLAIDTAAPPGGLPYEKFHPEVKVGRLGTTLTYLAKDQTAYDAGTPGAGEVWFLAGSKMFKLEAPPAAGETVYARVVPVLEVFESADSEKSFRSPVREPRQLVLMEA